MRPCSQEAIRSRVVLQPARRPFHRAVQVFLPTECVHPRSRDSVSAGPRRRFSLFRRLLAPPARLAATSAQSQRSNTFPTNLPETRRFGRPASFQLAAILLGTCVPKERPLYATRRSLGFARRTLEQISSPQTPSLRR